MTLPKIKKFTDYNHYPDEAQPTTDEEMQDYMLNQNDILGALTKRLWQPQTEYKLGDIVASDAMADGLVAVCTVAGVTSDIEPEWGVNEAAVIDNSCTWIMRPAYCYGLATDGDVQTVYDGGEAEVSRLLSLGVLDKIFEIFKGRIGELFGDNDVLPIANGGTGQTTAADAIKAFFGSGSIGSSNQPIYYKDGKLYAGGYTFRLNHNTTDDKIPVFANGMLDYILKSELANATTGGGIVAALLKQNGYVKFSNGLILQWGYANNTSVGSGHSGTYSASFPIVFSTVYQIVCSTVKEAQSYKGAPNIHSYTTSTVTFSTYDGWYVDKAMYIAIGR